MRRRRNGGRIGIRRGIWSRYYEPHDMPGALIRVEHDVMDPHRRNSPDSIHYDGPGFVVEHPRGVPKGWGELWLGREQDANPITLYYRKKPTADSDQYDKGYRHGWRLKRAPRYSHKMSTPYVEGLQSGWADNPRNPKKRY